MFKFGSKNDVNIDYKCTLRLLDDNEILQCDFQRDHKGQFLLDYVCTQLNLVEKDYFGLRYVDQNKQRHWLDPTRSIVKQIKGIQPIIFCFRVKFYPPDPYRLREEITKYQIFLQLRRDLLHGRLYCSFNDSALLAAYIVQSELGDYEPDEHVGNYVSEFKLVLKQTIKNEEKISEIHQTQLRGQVPSVSEINFLKKACLLDTYGVDPHPVKDHKGVQLYLGVNYAGIITFQGSRKTHHFKWQDVQRLNYEGKMFIIHLMFNEKKHTVGFKCPTGSACRHLWRCAVEQRLFFTLSTSSQVPSVVTGGSFFSRGSRFRYSGRVEKEILEDTHMIKREQPLFVRNSLRSFSLRQKSASFSNPSQTPANESTAEPFTLVTRPGHTTPMSEGHYARTEDEAVTPQDHHQQHQYQQHQQQQQQQHPQQHHYQQQHDETFPPSRSSTYDDVLEPVEEEYAPPPSSNINNAVNSHAYFNHADSAKQQQQQQQNEEEEKETNMYDYKSAVITKKKWIRITIPTFLAFFSLCFVLLLLESNSDFLSDVRKLPELVILRREYYEPAKEFLVAKIRAVFSSALR
uniref:Moesin/ezrin/radixin homolog 1 n=1 Tax=Strigamia maritima TaxID=126957 RepID=T1JFR0_STRMM